MRTLPLVSAADKRSMTEDRLLDEVAKMRIGKADAVFISCTNIPSFGVLAPLRDKLGVPVLSSNSALLAQLVDAASRRLDARAK
jgi:Maleate cis-trans isomerase